MFTIKDIEKVLESYLQEGEQNVGVSTLPFPPECVLIFYFLGE